MMETRPIKSYKSFGQKGARRKIQLALYHCLVTNIPRAHRIIDKHAYPVTIKYTTVITLFFFTSCGNSRIMIKQRRLNKGIAVPHFRK